MNTVHVTQNHKKFECKIQIQIAKSVFNLMQIETRKTSFGHENEKKK